MISSRLYFLCPGDVFVMLWISISVGSSSGSSGLLLVCVSSLLVIFSLGVIFMVDCNV